MENIKHQSKPSKRWFQSRLAITIGAILLLTISGASSVSLLAWLNKSNTAKYTETNLPISTPDFQTVLPGNKSLQDLGGWTLISPPDKDPVYAYVDYIDNIRINVSQQSLPDDFKSDTSKKIEELAKSFNATTALKIDDIIAYIGTSAEGPQSVIFTEDNLLVLIKSTSVISNNKWVDYIKTLK